MFGLAWTKRNERESEKRKSWEKMRFHVCFIICWSFVNTDHQNSAQLDSQPMDCFDGLKLMWTSCSNRPTDRTTEYVVFIIDSIGKMVCWVEIFLNAINNPVRERQTRDSANLIQKTKIFIAAGPEGGSESFSIKRAEFAWYCTKIRRVFVAFDFWCPRALVLGSFGFHKQVQVSSALVLAKPHVGRSMAALINY